MPDARLPENLNGSCDERFAAVADLLSEQVRSGYHHGVTFAAYFRGEPVIDLWGGAAERDTMVMSFSTTKGVTATALHVAMDRSGTSYDMPVAEVWPEFANKGKEHITIRHLLCHEAGVPQIRDRIDDVSVMADWEHMVGMIEGLEPLWEPGTGNGYHAINYGWLVGETLRRIDGRDLSTFLAEELAGPLDLDGLYIGTPPEEHRRIKPLLGPESNPLADDDAYDQRIPKDTILWNALSPRGSIVDLFNTPAGMSACIPAISGAFTARSLAKLYAMLEHGGELDGVRILSSDAVETATTVQNERADFVMFLAPHWRLGYASGGSTGIPVLGPNESAFGHMGAGGTFAAADPKGQVSYALIHDRWFPEQFLGGPEGKKLADAVVAAAEAAL